ncbi:MAG: flavodoxin family protein [Candidatus Bathyarchaeota archaeon]|nr:flavodoxin family protein [Candidatus Bathyarchaeota archaeon]
MKVLAVNGSARMENGYTAMLLAPFLEGMKEAGAQVELFYARRLNVNPCTGEFYCWYEKPGECYIRDSMQLVYPRLREADVLVLGIPVYIPLSGEMQNFINRLCPLIEPILSKRNGRTRAKFHDNVRIKKIALVSACGWWEKGNFLTVLRIVEEIARDVNVEFAGALLRPHAHLLAKNKEKTKEILEAAKQAGFQLAKDGTMSKNLLETVAQPLISEETFRQRDNDEYVSLKRKG